jgi:uncharacterized protein (TIGR02679 family)
VSAAVELSALQRPELTPVFARIREHVERYGWSRLGMVTIDLAPDQALALAALMGTAQMRTGRVRVDLSRLDAALRSSRLDIGLVDALERLGGRLVDHRQIRADATVLDAALWERLASRAALIDPALRDWLARLRARGTARRLLGDDIEPQLENVLDVLGELPCDHVPLQRLAVRFGSAHALEWNRPLGSLTMSALAYMRGQETPSSALGRRKLWGEFGIVLDTLSTSVLALNLCPVSNGLAAAILRACAAASEPASLTLGQLMDAPLAFRLGHAPVLVCENPTVMEDIKTRTRHARPMVCVAGRPNTAASTLLEYVVASGVTLRYHGDFDYPGIAIANEVVARFRAVPLLFDAATYLRALERHPGHPLMGRPVEASWDRQLASAMMERQRAVHEEALADELLEASNDHAAR